MRVIFFILTTKNWFVTKKTKKTLKFHALFPNCQCLNLNCSFNFNVWDLRPRLLGKLSMSAFQWCYSQLWSILRKSWEKLRFVKVCVCPPKFRIYFFLRIFVFFGQKSACTMFLTRPKTFGGSIRTFSCMGCIVLDTLYCNLWSLNQWIVLKKMRCWKK